MKTELLGCGGRAGSLLLSLSLLWTLAGMTACQYDGAGFGSSGTTPERAGGSGGGGRGGAGGRGGSGTNDAAVERAEGTGGAGAPTPLDATADLLAMDAEADASAVDAASVDAVAPPPVDMGPGGPPPPGFCPARDDLVLCLRFEERVVDESKYAHPVRGGSGRYAAGPSGRALEFRGGDDFRVPESPGLDAGQITIEAAINARYLGRRMGVLDNPGQYGLYVLPSGNAMCSGRGGYVLRNAVIPGRWVHLLCTFDDTSIVMYIDGERVGDAPAGPVGTSGNEGLYIGGENEPARTFDGLMDNVRIWRALRPPQAANR